MDKEDMNGLYSVEYVGNGTTWWGSVVFIVSSPCASECLEIVGQSWAYCSQFRDKIVPMRDGVRYLQGITATEPGVIRYFDHLDY